VVLVGLKFSNFLIVPDFRQDKQWNNCRSCIGRLGNQSYLDKFLTKSNEIMTDAVNLIRSRGSHIDKFDDIILRIAAEREFFEELFSFFGNNNFHFQGTDHKSILFFLTQHKQIPQKWF